MIFAILLIVIGLVLALAVPHPIISVLGWILVVVGVIYLILVLVPTDADAALLIPFGPHAARLLRWAAGKLDGNRFSDEQVAEMDKRLGELFHVADVPVSQGPTTFDHAWAIYPDGTSEDVSSRNQG
jgi:hypothetical protein